MTAVLGVCGGRQKSTMWSPELFMDPKVCLIVVVTCSVMSLSSSRYVFLSESFFDVVFPVSDHYGRAFVSSVDDEIVVRQ